MLHLKTDNNERLEIPESAIIAITLPSSGDAPSGIIYDMGSGPQSDHLSDQYGYLKKLVVDAAAIVNPVEVRVIEKHQVGEGEEAIIAHREGKLFFSRLRINGRREKKGDPNGANAILFVDLLGKPMAIEVADTLDELDGVEGERKAPASTAGAGAKGARAANNASRKSKAVPVKSEPEA